MSGFADSLNRIADDDDDDGSTSIELTPDHMMIIYEVRDDLDAFFWMCEHVTHDNLDEWLMIDCADGERRKVQRRQMINERRKCFGSTLDEDSVDAICDLFDLLFTFTDPCGLLDFALCEVLHDALKCEEKPPEHEPAFRMR